jgi:WD40 repeat protein
VRSDHLNQKPPTPSVTPGSNEFAFEPCAATASFLLYAQRNVILVLHHDTLAVERKFTRHREDVSWLSVDTVSERGSGRLVVSYDAGSTAIVWDLLTGDEVARFASYDQIRVASWMRNGNVAFGWFDCAALRLPFPSCSNLPQETRRATSSCSSLPLLSTYRRGPFLTR